MRTSPVEVEREVATYLHASLGDDLLAAFLYGSVVTGGATAASDIDCFAIVRIPLSRQTHDLVSQG